MITDLQVRSPRLGGVLTDSLPISSLVNDVVIHPNQGELISCDQSGAIKQWDLSENSCTLELVRKHEFWPVLRPSPESSFELSNHSGVFFLLVFYCPLYFSTAWAVDGIILPDTNGGNPYALNQRSFGRVALSCGEQQGACHSIGPIICSHSHC